MKSIESDVTIIGGGLRAYLMALSLSKLNIRVTILDKNTSVSESIDNKIINGVRCDMNPYNIYYSHNMIKFLLYLEINEYANMSTSSEVYIKTGNEPNIKGYEIKSLDENKISTLKKIFKYLYTRFKYVSTFNKDMTVNEAISMLFDGDIERNAADLMFYNLTLNDPKNSLLRLFYDIDFISEYSSLYSIKKQITNLSKAKIAIKGGLSSLLKAVFSKIAKNNNVIIFNDTIIENIQRSDLIYRIKFSSMGSMDEDIVPTSMLYDAVDGHVISKHIIITDQLSDANYGINEISQIYNMQIETSYSSFGMGKVIIANDIYDSQTRESYMLNCSNIFPDRKFMPLISIEPTSMIFPDTSRTSNDLYTIKYVSSKTQYMQQANSAFDMLLHCIPTLRDIKKTRISYLHKEFKNYFPIHNEKYIKMYKKLEEILESTQTINVLTGYYPTITSINSMLNHCDKIAKKIYDNLIQKNP